MKCLTVKAPWAQMIVRGTGICCHRKKLMADRPYWKDVENRSWFPGKALSRGDRLAIHCGRAVDREAMKLFRVPPDAVAADLGCVLGTVEFLEARLWTGNERISLWHELDMVGWYLCSPLALEEPVPAKGRLGLWEFLPPRSGGKGE